MPSSQSREEISVEDVLEYLSSRFGVESSDLKRFDVIERSGDFWLVCDQHLPSLDYETHGVRFVRDTGKYLKPTTYGLQILDERISNAKIRVDRQQLETILGGGMVEKQVEINKGYVAIMYKKRVIGCGLYKDGLLSSRIPKGRGKELKNMI